MQDFEATCWEWETNRGFYLIDRAGFGYDVRYRPTRNHLDYWPVEPSDDHTAGQLEWETADDAMRACRLHYDLLATMTPSRACTEIARRGLAHSPTLTGLTPVCLPTTPYGAWQ
jgi:hypothetical protein